MPQRPIRVLDMQVVGRYADGAPRYSFFSSFPSDNIRAAGDVKPTPEEAYAEGTQIIQQYERADPMGNMGEVLGVIQVAGGYRPSSTPTTRIPEVQHGAL
ncbi:MAG: hypothetical protein ACRD7E_04015 [Bryobacteraceae bacterium]